jgi:hypothetical protein
MSWRDRLEAATVLRDEGVLLGYVSAGHRHNWVAPGGGTVVGEQVDPLNPPSPEEVPEELREHAREHQREMPDPGTVSLASFRDGDGGVAGWDPLARELYADSLLSGALDERTPRGVRRYAESVLAVHEATHDLLGARHVHQYKDRHYAQLMAARRLLRSVLYRGDATGFWQASVSGSHQLLVFSELAQELAAIRAQRRHLASHDDVPDPDAPGSPLPDFASAVDASLRNGRPTRAFAEAPEHATADWLRRRLADWEISLVEYAFAFQA